MTHTGVAAVRGPPGRRAARPTADRLLLPCGPGGADLTENRRRSPPVDPGRTEPALITPAHEKLDRIRRNL